MVHKRLPRDIDLLKKNEKYLQEKGIYFHTCEEDLTKLSVLITPRYKEDTSVTPKLCSPYTGGFFVFELIFSQDYPLSPPSVTFNPKQRFCRLHPNYYESGKVCLSIINTWAQPDWSPSMSLMSLLITLEERFFERALGCEPSYENTTVYNHRNFNEIVEYSKYHVVILDVLNNKYGSIYKPFTDVIHQEVINNIKWHEDRLTELVATQQGKVIRSICYNHQVTCDYISVKSMLLALAKVV